LDGASAQLKGSLIAPELVRTKEGLEAYPTDVIAMVGTIIKNGKPVALVKVEKLLYQVHLGSHLGQNYGLVTAINEHEVTLREIVQDGLGAWTERKAILRLQEGLK
jgi:type IV pilus assembly protein PilP